MNLFRWRRDVRRFKRDPLPEHMLERLLETGGLAPSVGLSEPWRFVIVADPGRRKESLPVQGLQCRGLARRSRMSGPPPMRA